MFANKVFDMHVADHKAQKAVFKVKKEHGGGFIKRRIYSEMATKVLAAIKNQNWFEVLSVNKANVFLGIFLSIFYNYFPIKNINLNKNLEKSKKDIRVTEAEKNFK